MWGKKLHSLMAGGTQHEIEDVVDSIDAEHRLSKHGTTTYLDLFVRKGSIELAIEIETTARHAVDNAKKAAMVDAPLWLIVPTRRLKSYLTSKLAGQKLRPGGEPIRILLLGEVRPELTDYLSRRIDGRINNKKTNNRQKLPSAGSRVNYEN